MSFHNFHFRSNGNALNGCPQQDSTHTNHPRKNSAQGVSGIGSKSVLPLPADVSDHVGRR
jgi:hypothetical protein